jgi:hypothetical protein
MFIILKIEEKQVFISIFISFKWRKHTFMSQ